MVAPSLPSFLLDPVNSRRETLRKPDLGDFSFPWGRPAVRKRASGAPVLLQGSPVHVSSTSA